MNEIQKYIFFCSFETKTIKLLFDAKYKSTLLF